MKFEWEDGYTEIRDFGSQLKGITHGRERPIRVALSVYELSIFTLVPDLIRYLNDLTHVNNAGLIILLGDK